MVAEHEGRITNEMLAKLAKLDAERAKFLEENARRAEIKGLELNKVLPTNFRVLWTTNTHVDGVHRRGPTRHR